MMTMKIDDNGEIALLLELVPQLTDKINNLLSEKNSLVAEWYNDEACWKLKGGCALNTFRAKRWHRPKGGIPDAMVGGRNVWHRDTVQEWLPLTDEKLVSYHEKYKTGAKRDT